jgi:hypothetical protein
MHFDPTKVLVNARAADTDELLDQVTAYRAGMEPDAIVLFEMELHRRGVTAEQIALHARQYENCLRAPNGSALICSWCRRPAVGVAWDWHRLWDKIPVFPRRFRFCSEHGPSTNTTG